MTFDWPHPIEAVFYDMDGTLLDSEPLTEAAVDALLTQNGIDDKVDATQFHGVTWKSIAQTLVSMFPKLEGLAVADELSIAFQHALQSQTPPPILGARAVSTSAGLFKTAVVSSDRRNSIHFVVGKMGLIEYYPSHCRGRRRSTFQASSGMFSARNRPLGYSLWTMFGVWRQHGWSASRAQWRNGNDSCWSKPREGSVFNYDDFKLRRTTEGLLSESETRKLVTRLA